jgi:alcohol oxidase
MADVKPLTWSYKFAREIARRMPHFRGEPPAFHPAFPSGSSASIVEKAEGPIPFDAPRIVYSEADEAAIEAYARATSAYFPSIQTKKRAHYLPLDIIIIVIMEKRPQ